MAIKIFSDEADKFNLELNNGELRALNEIMSIWKFKDKKSALQFAIAVLNVTRPGKLYQEKDDGIKTAIVPIENLVKE